MMNVVLVREENGDWIRWRCLVLCVDIVANILRMVEFWTFGVRRQDAARISESIKVKFRNLNSKPFTV